jgi:glucose-1-phosphate cytidylyltransferase
MGTRLAEETTTRPKPMIEIGERPILWHIMKSYSHYGFHDFLVALGYKGDHIKRYFVDYYLANCSIKISLTKSTMDILEGDSEDWNVSLIETGNSTNTGGRLKRLQKYLSSDTFMLTYGDGVSTVDIQALLAFHKAQGCIATITVVHPPARFGGVDLEGNTVVNFAEKSQIREGWINGGFMVLEPAIFDYIEGDHTVLEADVLERLAEERQLAAYQHPGFWQCMDTLRDKKYLEELWQTGEAPWKLW